MKVGVARETAPGERRVALVPEAIGKLTAAGLEVLVERGAGAGCRHPRPGLRRRRRDGRLRRTSCTRRPTSCSASRSPADGGRDGCARARPLVGLLQPLIDPAGARALANAGVTAISLDALPRTLSRAQTMDALSSQANVGGYKAVLIAANAYPRYFPLLTTAAGTAKPANVLILGIGVAGLQAIGDGAPPRRGRSRRMTSAPETREQAESLGAQFVKLKTRDRRDRRGRLRPRADGRGAGGPAGRAQRRDRRHGRRDHHGPGARPQAAGAGDRGRRRADEAGLGDRRHGGARARRQRASCPRPARRS